MDRDVAPSPAESAKEEKKAVVKGEQEVTSNDLLTQYAGQDMDALLKARELVLTGRLCCLWVDKRLFWWTGIFLGGSASG